MLLMFIALGRMLESIAKVCVCACMCVCVLNTHQFRWVIFQGRTSDALSKLASLQATEARLLVIGDDKVER